MNNHNAAVPSAIPAMGPMTAPAIYALLCVTGGGFSVEIGVAGEVDAMEELEAVGEDDTDEAMSLVMLDPGDEACCPFVDG